MLNNFFGLKESPFNLTPDPHFFYTNSMYQEAYDKLLYLVQEHKGYLILTGDAGSGKTTLLKTLMEEIDTACCVYFEYTNLTLSEFLCTICNKLELAVENEQGGQALERFLLEKAQSNTPVVFFIDEAQDMPEESLVDLLLYVNSLIEDEKPIKIVLAGQPELEINLAQAKPLQIKSHLALHYCIDCLKNEEVSNFIYHRLFISGHSQGDLITPEAIQRVRHYAQGLPRLINLICNKGLILAYNVSQTVVSAEMIENAIRDLRRENEALIDVNIDEEVEVVLSQPHPKDFWKVAPGYSQKVLTFPPWEEKERHHKSWLQNTASPVIKAFSKSIFRLREMLCSTQSRLYNAASLGVEFLSKTVPIFKDKLRQSKCGLSSVIVLATKFLKMVVSAMKEKLSLFSLPQRAWFGTGATVLVLSWLLAYPVVEDKQIRDESISSNAVTINKQAVGIQTAEIAQLNYLREELEKKLAASEERQAILKLELTKMREELKKTDAIKKGGKEKAQVYSAEIGRFHNLKLTSVLSLPNTEIVNPNDSIFVKSVSAFSPVYAGKKLENKSDTVQALTVVQNNVVLETVTKVDQPESKNTIRSEAVVRGSTKVRQQPSTLLARADRLMKARLLTTPVGKNALEVYRQVLQLKPGHEGALDGIDRIKEQYKIWGRKAQERENWVNANSYYKKALMIDPSDKTIAAEFDQVIEKIKLNREKDNKPEVAANERRAEKTRQMLEQKDEVAISRALWTSIEAGDINTVNSLLATGISSDIKREGGWTLLMFAAIHGHIDIVRALLDRGVDVNARNHDGKTALAAAAWNGHTAVVKALLDRGVEVNTKNHEGWTALMHAAWNGHRSIVEALLAKDAEASIKDRDGWTALAAAKSEGHTEIVKILMKAVES